MLSTTGEVENEKENPNPVHPEKRQKRRSHHKRPGRHGKFVVLLMSFLVLACIGISAFLAFRGEPHPLIATWGEITRLVAHGLFAVAALLCLRSLYRGSLAVKPLIAVFGILVALTFAILITLDLFHEAPGMWLAFDSLGMITAAFAAWVCLFSKSATRFISLQTDKPH